VADSAIGWTDKVWNPTTGCDKVSPGCGLPLAGAQGEPHGTCYALTLARRLKAMGNPKYQRDGDPRTSGPGFGLTEHPDTLDLPLRWRKPQMVFVNSMSDLFHPKVSDQFIVEVFARMWWAPQHTFQVLTKRPARLAGVLARVEDALRGRAEHLSLVDCPTPLPWPLPNVWLGTSVEDQQRAEERIPRLWAAPAAVRWISAEPLLSPVELEFVRHFDPGPYCGCDPVWGVHEPSCGCEPGRHWGLHWIVVGGESGPGYRPMDMPAALHLIEQCKAAGVPVFVKQDSGPRSGQQGRFPDDVWALKQYPQHAGAPA
jgi:protein gp37